MEGGTTKYTWIFNGTTQSAIVWLNLKMQRNHRYRATRDTDGQI